MSLSPVSALDALFARPVAHRAYHDLSQGRPENSLEAVRAAVEAGYAIEIDVQLSSDGEAMVFHDYELERLTDEEGLVRERSAAELGAIRLKGGASGIPTLAEVLAEIDGRVALVVELKDSSRSMSETDGLLEAATARALKGYAGPVVVMSFNPEMMARMAELAPEIPRGLTTYPFEADDFPGVADWEVRAAHLTAIADYERVGASFLSHFWKDLAAPRVAELKAQGARILCWTVRSAEVEAQAREIAENITFETYPAL